MIHTLRALFVCSLLGVFTVWSGCGGNGDVQSASPPGNPPVSKPPASSAGAGFNQARGFNERVAQILPLPDGSGDVYVSGDFTTYSNQAVRPVVRLRPNGSINEGFALANSITGRISSIALADDGSGDLFVADSTVDQSIFPLAGTGHIRRVNPDGTIDSSFTAGTITVVLDAVPSDPIFSAVVRSLAPVGDGSGRVYAAVEGQYNNTPVGPVVRLNPNGSLDTTFVSQTSFQHVFRVVPADDGSGDVYIATFRRQDPNTWVSYLLLRLNADGTLDPGFDTGVAGSLESRISLMVPVADGSGDLFAEGVFPNFADPSPIVNAFRGLVRIDPSGAMDLTSSRPQVDPLSRVLALAKSADGSGDWFVAQTKSSNEVKLLRYKADGTLNPAFAAAQFGDATTELMPARDGSGDLYVGGQFLSCNGKGVSHLVRLNNDGTLDTGTATGSGFNATAFPVSVAAVRDGSGSVYATGLFTLYNGATANQVTRLTASGQQDPTFSTGPGFGGLGFRVIPASTHDGTGRLYVAGDFSAYDGQPVTPLVRLLSDGKRDAAFTPEFNPGSVIETVAVAEDGTGDLYAGGEFNSYKGTAVSGAVRIHADGSLDRGFTSMLQPGTVRQIVPAVDGSGDVYVRFLPRNGPAQLFRLNRDGTMDRAFVVPEPYASQSVAMAVLRDGSGNLLVASSTANASGTYQSRLVRLTPDGIIDAGFNLVTLDGFVYDVEPSDGTEAAVYTGGAFTTVNGTASPGIVRIDRNGKVDPSFAVGTGFNNFVWSIDSARDGSGDLFVGGTFTKYRSTTMQGIARLNRDGSAD